jgi:CBS domain-containing membrane protein
MIRRLAGFGPSMPRPHAREVLRATAGVAVGLLACGVLLVALGREIGPMPGLILLAPMGATAFLLFAVPNSPLAQPWSAVVGNTLSGAAGFAAVASGLPPLAAAPLAVGLAVAAMGLARALHPPGAAVALAAVLAGAGTKAIGPSFPLMPVALDTLTLVAVALIWNRATGRAYPFLQTAAVGTHGTRDPAPERRLLPSPEDLATLRDAMNLGPNIGAEDLARLLDAAEAEAAARRFAARTCGDVMSRDLVTVRPDALPADIADLFHKHNFRTLPVVGPDAEFLGLIAQGDLIHRAFPRHGVPNPTEPLARDIMETGLRTVAPETPLGAVLPILGDSGVQAAPVLSHGRLVGLVTRSDLIALLARLAPPG